MTLVSISHIYGILFFLPMVLHWAGFARAGAPLWRHSNGSFQPTHKARIDFSPQFLPVLFRLRTFSIQLAQVSWSLEQAINETICRTGKVECPDNVDGLSVNLDVTTDPEISLSQRRGRDTQIDIAALNTASLRWHTERGILHWSIDRGRALMSGERMG